MKNWLNYTCFVFSFFRLIDLKAYSNHQQPKLRNLNKIKISKSLDINKINYFSGAEENMDHLAHNAVVDVSLVLPYLNKTYF